MSTNKKIKTETDINKIIDEIFENLKNENKGFSNEAQMQHELAIRFRDYGIIEDVELEELSSNLSFEEFNGKDLHNKNKYYIDLVLKLKNSKEYVVIELKFKTPIYNVNIVKHTTNNKDVFYTFKQGAEDEGVCLFWRDVERLEKFNDQNSQILLNFDENKKVVKKFVILMTNAPIYWTGNEKSLCLNFFPKDNKSFSGDLCWKIKLYNKKYRVSGKTSKKINGVDEVELKFDDHKKHEKYYKIKDIDSGNIDEKLAKSKPIIPVRLKGEYKCVWRDYIEVTTESISTTKYDKFRYLVLEVK